jgi:hypothetical protein
MKLVKDCKLIWLMRLALQRSRLRVERPFHRSRHALLRRHQREPLRFQLRQLSLGGAAHSRVVCHVSGTLGGQDHLRLRSICVAPPRRSRATSLHLGSRRTTGGGCGCGGVATLLRGLRSGRRSALRRRLC